MYIVLKHASADAGTPLSTRIIEGAVELIDGYCHVELVIGPHSYGIYKGETSHKDQVPDEMRTESNWSWYQIRDGFFSEQRTRAFMEDCADREVPYSSLDMVTTPIRKLFRIRSLVGSRAQDLSARKSWFCSGQICAALKHASLPRIAKITKVWIPELTTPNDLYKTLTAATMLVPVDAPPRISKILPASLEPEPGYLIRRRKSQPSLIGNFLGSIFSCFSPSASIKRSASDPMIYNSRSVCADLIDKKRS
jgi:hypothetical protein